MSYQYPFYHTLCTLTHQYQAALIAVSKLQSVERMKALYDLGQRHFAENYVQELLTKAPLLPEDIIWHFTGHLQSNKVRLILPLVSYIHSIDSKHLFEEVQKQALAQNRQIKVLLQVKIAQEETKYGLDTKEVEDLATGYISNPTAFSRVTIMGLMGMASFVSDKERIRSEFLSLKKIFDTLKQNVFQPAPSFNHLSMGMSGDYPIALECGATMIRIGTALFGERVKPH